MLDTTKPLVSLDEMEIYHEEMIEYIKSLGIGLTEEDINGLIDEKLVPVNETIENKVEKVDGMGLSTNDYSNAEKEKLGAIGSITTAQIDALFA